MPRRGKDIWEESFTWILLAMIPVFVAVVWSFQYVLAWFRSQPAWVQVIEVLGVAAIVAGAVTLYLRSRKRYG